MKNTGYVYANKALESAVKDLKSSFFDIFYHSQGTLLMLMTQLDELEVDNQSLKEEAVDLINLQGTLLSESMALVEELIRSIKKIDNNSKKIDKFNRSYVISRSKQFAKVDGKPVGVVAPVAEVTTEVKTEPVTDAATEVQTESVTEAATKVQTESVTEAATKVQTESVTEAVTKVQTESVTEVTTEVKTEPVTEATTEVKTEPVTEVTSEVQTEPVADVTSEVQVEESAEISTTSTGLELDPNAPVEEATEPAAEKPKKYIADTPEGVVKDLKQALLTMPGMENLKFDSQGNPDFSSVLPQDVLDDFNSKFGFQVSVKKKLNNMEDAEMDDSEKVEASVSTVDLPFALEPVIPTPAPPAPPIANSISQGELTTEAVTEVTTEAAPAAVIPGTEVVADLAMAGIQVAMPTEDAAIEGQILPFGEVSTETATETVTEVTTEAATEDNTVRRFFDQSAKVKAILVTDKQFNKLAGSRVTQEALLTFKRILPGKGHSGTHLVTVESSHAESSTVPVTENMTVEDKNRTIEAMMVDANKLYNSGKIAEAQALYDKISEINET